MVSVGRILRDYRESGSVNGLLALWGFVDDTTFLTKAGHVGVVYRMRGIDYEGLSHPPAAAAGAPLRGCPSAARRALSGLPVPLQAAASGPSVPAACPHPGGQRGDPAPRRLPEHPTAGTLRSVALPGPPLRGAARRPAGIRAARGVATLRRRPSERGCRPTTRCRSRSRTGSGRRHAAPQGAGVRGAGERSRAGEAVEGRRLPVLPVPGQLRAGRRGCRPPVPRHAPGLLRLRLDGRVPPRPPARRRPAGARAVDEGAAQPDVRIPAAGPVRSAGGVRRLPGVAANPERPVSGATSRAAAGISSTSASRWSTTWRQRRSPRRCWSTTRRPPPSVSWATR